MDEPKPGSIWVCRHTPKYRFRYDGRAYDGAYRFTRFFQGREMHGQSIEIYSLDDMELFSSTVEHRRLV